MKSDTMTTVHITTQRVVKTFDEVSCTSKIWFWGSKILTTFNFFVMFRHEKFEYII